MSAQRVLITAGAGGIGLASAKAFAASGAKVWVTDISADAIACLPDGIRGSVADASDEVAIATVFAEILAEWGGLDVLFANAGVAGPTALIEDIALKDWQRCVSVNLEGAFLAAKFAAPMMKAQCGGVILITSSTAGQHGYPNRAPYAAAKWAMIGLMKTLAMELGPHGIRANAICPGSVEGTRMEGVMQREADHRDMSRDDIYKAYASGTSMQTWITGEDIANMAVFLASDGARFVSGQVIAVDGDTFNPDPAI
jgi:NAD(P)-dependent dehydrogenase (short-subunit alcohol dehydrogenase family)